MVNWKALEEDTSEDVSFRDSLIPGATLSSSSGASSSRSSSDSSFSDPEENIEKPRTLAHLIVWVRGKGKKTAIIREPRDAPTNLDEEMPSKPKTAKKLHQKLTAIAREGHSLDRFFPIVSLIVPRVHILGNQEWVVDFAQILVHSQTSPKYYFQGHSVG
jgi:hypothetical protein